MVTISVVLATFNEEENLPGCLESVKNLADEIIVVDGSSKDRTLEIAKRYGTKVVVTDNPKNFHINKQKAIDLASKDWILQLDADERITLELAEEIKSKIKYGRSHSINGYWIPRKNWFLGRFLMKGGQYPDYSLRLYKRGKGMLPQKDVHEQARVEGEAAYLVNSLMHYSYKNFSHYIYKWNKYNDILAAQIRSELKNSSLKLRIFYFFGYLFVKPLHWFLITYIRHKGFMDLWPGFVFSFFSALRFPIAYAKHFKTL